MSEGWSGGAGSGAGGKAGASRRRVFRFGRFTLDAAARELRDEAGELVAMPPKSLECVVYLIEHRARAVGRDELISAVWGSTEVSDHSLGQTLLRARQALGDVGGGERSLIRTVPRFGYRWIALVEEAEPVAPVAGVPKAAPDAAVSQDDIAAPLPVAAAPVSDIQQPSHAIDPHADDAVLIASPSMPTPASAASRPRRRLLLIVAIVLLVALIVVSVLLAMQPAPLPTDASAEPDTSATPPTETPRLFMVLPVKFDSADATTTWVRLGVMDYIGTLLRDEAGQAVLPSDQVVTLIGRDPVGGAAQGDAGHGLGRLRVASGATHIVVPRAELDDGRWYVELDLYRDDTLDTYTGSANAPLEAAAQAVGQMLAQLRLHRIWEDRGPAEDKELLARIDAALLVGELQHADELFATASPATRAAPQFQVRAGNVALRQGRLAEAEALYRPVADDAAIDNAPLRAAASMGLGAVAILESDNAAADAAYSDAIALLAGGQEAGLLGRSYMGRGAARVLLERFDDAASDFSRARVDLERAGDRIGLATLDTNVAMAAHNRGRFAEALAAQDRAIGVLAGFGVRDQLVVSLHNKIYTQLALLDVAGAEATGALAMEQVERLANAAFNRRVAAAYTRALIAAGRLREAAETIERFDTQPDDPAASDTEFAALRIALQVARGNDAGVLAQADTALARIARAADLAGQSMLSETCWMIVQAAVRAQRPDVVEHVLEHLVAAPLSLQDLDRPVILDLIRAERARPSDRAAAVALDARALVAAEARGAPEIVITAAVASLRSLLAAGDLDAAAAVGGRLSPYADRDYRAARATAALYEALGRRSLARSAIEKARALAGERDIAGPY